MPRTALMDRYRYQPRHQRNRGPIRIGEFLVCKSLIRSLLLLALAVVRVTPTSAAEKRGTIVSEVWTKAMSPIQITGDIQIAGLTVEPGVDIEFTGEFQFTVSGAMRAIGAEDRPIRFHPRTGQSWKGIVFQNTAPGCELVWCIVEGANNSGISILDSFPVLRHCVLRDNRSSRHGGGLRIALTIPGNLTLFDCTIARNSTSSDYTVPRSNGAGISVDSGPANITFLRCAIEDNQAATTDGGVIGGGARVNGNIRFLRCTIQRNVVTAHDAIPGGGSSAYGGGCYIEGGSIAFVNTLLLANRASGSAPGGFSGNVGYASGGGLYVNAGTVQLLNSIVADNTANGSHGSLGGGVCLAGGTSVVENCTLVRNSPHAIYATPSNTKVANSILYFNQGTGGQISGPMEITYSDVQGGVGGVGNINLNPILDDTLKIVLGSPAIDAGNPDGSFADPCFPPSLGLPRNDMGAHGGRRACDWITEAAEPIVIAGPKSAHTCAGSTVAIQVTAAGSEPLGFQWYKSGTQLTGATNSTLEIPSANIADAGEYSVEVSNAFGSIRSTAATVSISPICSSLRMFAGIVLKGVRNQKVRIEYTEHLNAPNWTVLEDLVVSTDEQIVFDRTSPDAPERFYRITPIE